MSVVSTETAVIAGAGALVASEQVRNVLRKGAVYGLAGVIGVVDTLVGAAKEAVDEAQEVRASTNGRSSRRPATAKT